MRKQTGETLLVKKSGGKYYIPEEGDIIWIDLDPQAGCEQKGHRPAVVLSPISYNQRGLVLICPIRTKEKGYSFELRVPDNLSTEGVILVNHIKSLDWKERKAKFIEKIDRQTLYEINNILTCFILPSVKNS